MNLNKAIVESKHSYSHTCLPSSLFSVMLKNYDLLYFATNSMKSIVYIFTSTNIIDIFRFIFKNPNKDVTG